jgi:hypothetical protein
LLEKDKKKFSIPARKLSSPSPFHNAPTRTKSKKQKQNKRKKKKHTHQKRGFLLRKNNGKLRLCVDGVRNEEERQRRAFAVVQTARQRRKRVKQ